MNKRIGLFYILCIGLLFGCQSPAYTLEEWLSDACDQMAYSDNSVITHWHHLLSDTDLKQPLRAREAAIILFDILDESGEDPFKAMVGLGYFSKSDLELNSLIDFEEAKSLLEMAKKDLLNRTFIEPVTDLELNQPVIASFEKIEELTNQSAGLYEVADGYYEVLENGNIQERQIDEVLSSLEIETTFTPDLSETAVFPQGTIFEADLNLESYRQKEVDLLKSKYFHFKIGDYKISGRIYDRGLDISCKRLNFHDMTLENQLSLSQLKLTADVSINPLNDPHVLLRADYHLSDTLSLSKNEVIPITKKELNPTLLKELQTRLSKLSNQTSLAQEDLELLRFSIPVPGTLKSLHVDMVLKLHFLLNGEASLTLESSQSHGVQSANGTLKKIQENQWTVEPYLDGSAEMACNLGFDLMIGKYLVTDLSCESGIGAQGTAFVYFVNRKEKSVEKETLNTSLEQVNQVLNLYSPTNQASIDTCLDVNVYWFIRLNIASSSKCLLKRLGVSHSFTPVKENISLLHIENHQVVKQCTRVYDLNEIAQFDNVFQISEYKVTMLVGQKKMLTIENNTNDHYQWQSSDPDIVMVDNGKLEALSAGTALITVRDSKGNENVCVVTVFQEESEP